MLDKKKKTGGMAVFADDTVETNWYANVVSDICTPFCW